MADRRVIAAVVAAGLAGVPACSLRFGGTEVVAETAPLPVPAPVGSQFATLPAAPGQHIPLNPEMASVAGHTVERQPDGPPGILPDIEPPPLAPGGQGSNAPPTPHVPAPSLAPTPPPDPPLVGVFRAYLSNDPPQAVRHLEGFGKPNQDLLLQLVPAVVQASTIDFARASPTEVAALARQIEAPVAALNTRAPLFVDKAVFCRSVANFGRYDPLPDRHPFAPGKVAELYVEVRNVPSEPTAGPDGDAFVTKLVCTLQVRDAAGNVVPLPDRTRQPVPQLNETKRDVTRSPLRDYFLLFRFPVPLTPGDYTVSFEVQDPATGRAVSRAVRLRVSS